MVYKQFREVTLVMSVGELVYIEGELVFFERSVKEEGLVFFKPFIWGAFYFSQQIPSIIFKNP